jgi:predicted aminopeptidase
VRELARFTFIALVLCLVSACSTIGYYGQAVKGHMGIIFNSQPMDEAIEQASKENYGSKVKQLQTLTQARKFAVTELSLPDNGSYKRYVQLSKPYPVWNVVAAPEFSTQAQQWCYLVIGCASYRGYYDKQHAIEYADSLRQQGLDVHVYGVVAYSTLGWFADSVLSSMLAYGELYAVEIMFHELAHQQLYFSGHSQFNEAFATAVAQVGVMRWLTAQDHLDELTAYQERTARLAEFEQLVAIFKDKLDVLYAQSLNVDAMRLAKQQAYTQFKGDYQRLKVEKWANVGYLDHWFDKPLNNARIALFLTYRDQVEQFVQLLRRCENDLARLYDRLALLEKQSRQEDTLLVPQDCR